MPSAVVKAGASERWIESDPVQFRERFNERSFDLRHHLSSHPLFQIDELMALVKRTRGNNPTRLYYDAGNVGVDQRWDSIPKAAFSIEDAMRRIEDCGAWIVIKHAQEDPAYRILLDKALAELTSMAGEGIEPLIKQRDILIFITSPKRITTYHIDRECNWILQIHGTKTLHVFDQNDRDVLPETEIERFWTIDNNAPKYKPELQDRAISYKLAPGVGVHVPVNAPHWVENDNNVSVTLSVNFQFKDRIRANVHRANYFLRRLGMKPSGPGTGPIRDGLKNTVMTGAVVMRRFLQGNNSPW
jgi:hypothetical protein